MEKEEIALVLVEIAAGIVFGFVAYSYVSNYLPATVAA